MTVENSVEPTEPQQQVMKKASELDIGWLKGDSVCSLSGPLEVEDDVKTLKMDSEKKLEFAWFAVKTKTGTTDQEQKEKMDAIRKQMELGILREDGMPYGTKKEGQESGGNKPKKPDGKLARKLLRARDRAIQKDMNKQIKEEQRKSKNGLGLNFK